MALLVSNLIDYELEIYVSVSRDKQRLSQPPAVDTYRGQTSDFVQ